MSCTHLDESPTDAAVPAERVCPQCVAMGGRWVHLRMCLACGQVGCCDNSPNTHATAHNRETGHPVIRSIEPGESWRWCYVDSEMA